jgi:hypothetical protein
MTRATASARLSLVLGALVAASALAPSACSSDVTVTRGGGSASGGPERDPGSPSVSSGGDDAGFTTADATTPETCQPGVFCITPPDCNGGTSTTLTGVVLDPAGKNPIRGAIVYIPTSATLAPIVLGTNTCVTCPILVSDYITAALTDPKGAFTLTNAPSGAGIPLVVQTGKWRREVTLPTVRACTTTPVAPELTRLPRNESEGDLPQMAVLTGACDSVACFLRRVGVDAEEFTGPGAGGRVDVYQGAGPGGGPGPGLAGGGGGTAGDCTGASGSCPLWSSKSQLEHYDTVILGCECGENNQTKPDKSPIHDWLGEGGTVIAIHNQETWFKNGAPEFQTLATWAADDAGAPGPFSVDRSFVKGNDYDEWLASTGALAPDGTVALDPAYVGATMAAVTPATGSRLIYERTGAGAGYVQTMSVLTPIGGVPSVTPTPAAGYCGRAVISDIHVGAGSAPNTAAVPASCASGDLSPEEKALEFMLFDTVPCVSNAPTKGHPPIDPPN